MEIGSAYGFCAHTAGIVQLIGYIFIIFKILIPILLIIYGVMDLAKAVISSEDKAIKKAVGTLGRRMAMAILIYFVPHIISIIFQYIPTFRENVSDFNVCKACIINPNGSTCADNVEKYSDLK